MARHTDISRRRFLERTTLGVAAVAVGCGPDGATDEDADRATDVATVDGTPPVDTDTTPFTCVETPKDIEGPFYIPDVPVRTELDLYGDVGPRLTVSGRVLDTACLPIAGAVVEIWHVAPDGAYDNTSPERRYRGQTAAAADGAWSFHTLMPIYYDGRPLHVHVKVWVGGVEALTTQIYFDDDPKSANQDPALVVPRTAVGDDFTCVFDLVISEV